MVQERELARVEEEFIKAWPGSNKFISTGQLLHTDASTRLVLFCTMYCPVSGQGWGTFAFPRLLRDAKEARERLEQYVEQFRFQHLRRNRPQLISLDVNYSEPDDAQGFIAIATGKRAGDLRLVRVMEFATTVVALEVE